MKKIIFVLAYLFYSFSVSAQIKPTEVDTQFLVFPMKGNFICYSFPHTMSNTKNDLKHYLSFTDSENSDFYTNFGAKSMSFAFSFSFINKKTQCFIIPPLIGENGSIELTLPTGSNLLESNLYFQLLTIKKFKVSSESVTATLKLELNGKNGYTLTFTNFLITFGGMQGGAFKIETLDLENVYNEIKANKKLDNKMYDKSAKNLKEIDDFVKKIDELFYKELDKVIQMDN